MGRGHPRRKPARSRDSGSPENCACLPRRGCRAPRCGRRRTRASDRGMSRTRRFHRARGACQGTSASPERPWPVSADSYPERACRCRGRAEAAAPTPTKAEASFECRKDVVERPKIGNILGSAQSDPRTIGTEIETLHAVASLDSGGFSFSTLGWNAHDPKGFAFGLSHIEENPPAIGGPSQISLNDKVPFGRRGGDEYFPVVASIHGDSGNTRLPRVFGIVLND